MSMLVHEVVPYAAHRDFRSCPSPGFQLQDGQSVPKHHSEELTVKLHEDKSIISMSYSDKYLS